MIRVDDALAAILERVCPSAPVQVPLAEAVGLALAAEVLSDVDSPPHDKAMVDGYAVIAADLHETGVKLLVLEEISAGMVPVQTVRPGCATRIMTGSPIPRGADAVVMVEYTECLASSDGQTVVRVSDRLDIGANIMQQGTALRYGQRVLESGHVIRAIDIGVLGEVGSATVTVYPQPSVAVLATGNELVPVDETPGPGQIRNSNGPMLVAQVAHAGGCPRDLGIARDQREQLAQSMREGLQSDLLLLSGGVSVGLLDLVPSVLESLGVKQVFHKVHLKPGKPLWFGTMACEGADKLVFGLPGNPVSSLVCFELFVRPTLARLSGRDVERRRQPAKLAIDYVLGGDRPTFYPARLSRTGDAAQVQPLNWKGSADLRTLADANCLICFPAGNHRYQAGDPVEVLML